MPNVIQSNRPYFQIRLIVTAFVGFMLTLVHIVAISNTGFCNLGKEFKRVLELFVNMEPDTTLPQYDIPIEIIVLIIQLLVFVLNIVLVVVLVLNKVGNTRLKNVILFMNSIGFTWAITVMIEQNFIRNIYLTTLVRVLGFILTLMSTLISMELINSFSMLSNFWNTSRVRWCQFTIIILHFTLCIGVYSGTLIKYDGRIRDVFNLMLIIWMVIAFLIDNLVLFYIAQLVYQDTLKQKYEEIYEATNTMGLKKNVTKSMSNNCMKLIITLLLICFIDVIGIIVYVYGYVQTPISSIEFRYAYSLQRLGATSMALRPTSLTIIFLQLRSLKFSKEIKKNVPISESIAIRFPVD